MSFRETEKRDEAEKRRNVMKIFEITAPAPSYPASVPTDYVLELVNRIHHSPEDIGDGDLGNRIWRFLRYELKQLPVKRLRQEWGLGAADVDAYAAMPVGTAPPIIYDPKDRSIIDGSHRLAAAQQRGDKTILAYVGTQPDPHWSPEGDDFD